MEQEKTETVGDLIKFLSQFNPELLVRVWDYQRAKELPLQHILAGWFLESNKLIIYD